MKVFALATMWLWVAAGTLGAADGWYVGGNFGNTDRREIDDVFVVEESPGVTTFVRSEVDSSDSGGKLFVGYRLHRNFGVEAAYVDLGEIGISTTVDLPFPGIPFPDFFPDLPFEFPPLVFDATFDIGTTGWGVSGVGFLPIKGNFELFGKAGLFIWSADAAVSAFATNNQLPTTTSLTVTDTSGEGLMAGVGAQYNFPGPISLRVEFERFVDVAGLDVDHLSAGVVWGF